MQSQNWIERAYFFCVLRVLWCITRLRWFWFHLHPDYIKFYMDANEAHFQNIRTGNIHSDCKVNFAKKRQNGTATRRSGGGA